MARHVRGGDVRLELPAARPQAPAGEPESHGGGPVYRWDPLFSRSDAVLKSIRSGTRQLQQHCERELAQWHEAAGEQALERAHDVEREARGDTAPGTAAANAAAADAAVAAATARAERSRKLSHRQVERMLPGQLPRLPRGPAACARAQGALQARREPREPDKSVWHGPLVGGRARGARAGRATTCCIVPRGAPRPAACAAAL